MIHPGERAIIQYSGGKDSTALLYVMRPWLHLARVVFCDTGAILPEIHEFIHETCYQLGARLEVIYPIMAVDQYTEEYGLPSDIVPFESTFSYREIMHGETNQLLQSYADCCGQMIWRPLAQYIVDNNIQLVFRGSKKSDTRVGVPNAHIENGVVYISPLWDWTHDDIFTYLKEQNVVLPPHYSEFNDSLDCWLCTGHLNHCGRERIQYVREYHSDKFSILENRIERVSQEVLRQVKKMQNALEV